MAEFANSVVVAFFIDMNIRQAASWRVRSPVMRYKMKTDSMASGL
jgi:hypothetical protein